MMQSKTHRFSLEHATQNAQVNCSDLICVELPESPTSGYRWQLAPHVTLPGLKLIEQQFSQTEPLAKGTRTFIFRPTGDQNQASLQFCLSRPSALEPTALQQFDLTVAIKSDSSLAAW